VRDHQAWAIKAQKGNRRAYSTERRAGPTPTNFRASVSRGRKYRALYPVRNPYYIRRLMDVAILRGERTTKIVKEIYKAFQEEASRRRGGDLTLAPDTFNRSSLLL